MSNIIKPLLPRIVRQDNLIQSLVLDVPFFEGNGHTPFDLVGNNKGAFVGTPLWQNGLYGKEVNYNGGLTGDAVTFALKAFQQNLPIFTIEQIIYVAANGTLTHYCASWGLGSGTIQRVSWEVDGATPINLKWFLYTSGTGGAWTTPVPTNSAYLHLIYAQDVAGLAAPLIWYNGEPQTVTQVVAATGTPNSDQGRLVIGNTADFDVSGGDNQSWQGPVVHTRMYNKILSQDEVNKLSRDPYFMYEGKRFVPKSSGTLYTKSLSDSPSFTESFVKKTTKSLINSLSLTESFKFTLDRAFSNSLSLTEKFTKSITRNITNTLSLTDTFIKKPEKVFINTLSLSEVISKSLVTLKSLTDSLSLTEVFKKMPEKLFVNTLSLTEKIIRSITYKLSDTLSLTEKYTKQLQRSFLNSLSLTEKFTKQTQKVLKNTLSLTEKFTRNITKIFSNTLSITEAFSYIKQSNGKIFAESLALSEKLVKNISKNFSDKLILKGKLIGLFTGQWSKIKKIVSTWVKIPKSGE